MHECLNKFLCGSLELVDPCLQLNRCKRESAEGEEGWRRKERERDGSWRYRFVTTKCVSLAAVAIFALIEFGFNRQSALPLRLSPSSVRPFFHSL